MRLCIREPIPEIEIAAELLNAAVVAHHESRFAEASELFRAADMKVVWDWLNSIWGRNSPHTQYRKVANAAPDIPKNLRALPRDATATTKRLIHERDGHYCRFCKIPVVRGSIRAEIHKSYPAVVPWGSTNASQHAAFQCMWAQYDHVLPHARGGSSELQNVVLTCAACNYGRGNYTLEEVGLAHPDTHAKRLGPWTGLVQFRGPLRPSGRPPEVRSQMFG